MAQQILSDLDFNNVSRITNLPQAVANGQPIVFEQLQAQIEGLAWKDDVVAAATTNVNLASPGATVDGVAMATSGRFLATAQTTASENGIYIWNGASVAATRAVDMNLSTEFNSAIVPVIHGGTSNGGTTWRCSTVNPAVGTTSIVFLSFQGASPSASETTAGIAEVATQAETDTGTDDLRIVTPLKLANYANKKLKLVQNIGDGSATQYDITHNFNTINVSVSVFRNGTPWDDVGCDKSRPTANTVRINFASAPTSNQFTVVILG